MKYSHVAFCVTLKVLIATIDAVGHFYTGKLQHCGRGWGDVGSVRYEPALFLHARP